MYHAMITDSKQSCSAPNLDTRIHPFYKLNIMLCSIIVFFFLKIFYAEVDRIRNLGFKIKPINRPKHNEQFKAKTVT